MFQWTVLSLKKIDNKLIHVHLGCLLYSFEEKRKKYRNASEKTGNQVQHRTFFFFWYSDCNVLHHELKLLFIWSLNYNSHRSMPFDIDLVCDNTSNFKSLCSIRLSIRCWCIHSIISSGYGWVCLLLWGNVTILAYLTWFSFCNLCSNNSSYFVLSEIRKYFSNIIQILKVHATLMEILNWSGVEWTLCVTACIWDGDSDSGLDM
jgi:hypothetical protein